MNIANSFIQIFRHIAVCIVNVFIACACTVHKVSTTGVGCGCYGIIHSCQFVTIVSIGQVIYKAVTACTGLAVALQLLDVAVLVIFGYFLRESVTAMYGFGQTVQAIIDISVRLAVCQSAPVNAPDIAIVKARIVYSLYKLLSVYT